MKKNQVKVSIVIPSYNSAKTIRESIESALAQEYPLKEVLLMDDCSTDDTVKIAREYPNVRIFVNPENFGIGVNLANCMEQAQGKYVLYLCSDDILVDKNVVKDIVQIFDSSATIGVIDRPYFQFMDGYPGAVTRIEEKNILMSSICPSGMAFRKTKVWGSNRIFIEMPLIVSQYLKEWEWTRMPYDTVGVRIHPAGNTGCKSSYYTESPVEVLSGFFGPQFKYHPGLIQLKCRAPEILWREIWLTIKLNPKNLLDPFFYMCAIVAASVPGSILRHLSSYYRHRVSRRKCYVIKRPIGEKHV